MLARYGAACNSRSMPVGLRAAWGVGALRRSRPWLAKAKGSATEGEVSGHRLAAVGNGYVATTSRHTVTDRTPCYVTLLVT